MIAEQNFKELKLIYKSPFKYEDASQQIFDCNNRLVLDVRGWGWLHSSGRLDAEIIQDRFGNLIVELLNRKFQEEV